MDWIGSCRAFAPNSPVSEKHCDSPSHFHPVHAIWDRWGNFTHLQWPHHPLVKCEVISPHFILPRKLAVDSALPCPSACQTDRHCTTSQGSGSAGCPTGGFAHLLQQRWCCRLWCLSRGRGFKTFIRFSSAPMSQVCPAFSRAFGYMVQSVVTWWHHPWSFKVAEISAPSAALFSLQSVELL